MEQFHERCLYMESVTSRNGMEMDVVIAPQASHKARSYNNSKTHTLRNSLLVFGIVGFLILGISTVSYFDLFASQTGAAHTIKLTVIRDEILGYQNKHFDAVYENCLGVGAAQSITVTCPDGKGYVYKAVLAMPHELAAKFSKDVFSVRGISLSESSDGSVVLKYQNKFYSTGFLETQGNA